MAITLNPKQEAFVAKYVCEGTDADAVLDEALQLLEEKKEYDRKLAELRAMVAEGEADIAAGRCREFTMEVAEEIKAKARASFLANSRGNSDANTDHTEQAEIDLDREWKYIAQYSFDAADELVAKVLSSAEIHAGQPGLGRERGDLGIGIRTFVVGKHVVLFRPDGMTIQVLRVFYGPRDIARIFNSDA